MQLTPKRDVDYFPLKISNSWSYEHEFSSVNYNFMGKAKWQVIDSTNNGYSIQYIIQETINGIAYASSPETDGTKYTQQIQLQIT